MKNVLTKQVNGFFIYVTFLVMQHRWAVVRFGCWDVTMKGNRGSLG